MDVDDASDAPGVRLVLTKDNAPPQHPFGPVDLPDRFARAVPALNNDDVPYFSFPVAFVVADTFEQATAAAAMVRVRYAPGRGAYDLHAAGPTAINPGHISNGDPADSAVGDFDSAFANAPVKVDSTYTTPYQNQAPIELHATMAVWDGPKLTVHTAAQLTTSPQEGLARTFNIRKEGCAHYHPLCRRWVRQQVAVLFRGDAGGVGRAHTETTGEGRNDTAAGILHD